MSADSRPAPPLFVVGAPRSGTSLVYRALALHPQAAWINNYQRRLPGLSALAGLNRLGARRPDARRTVWFGADGDNAYRYNTKRSLAERFYPQPVEGEPVFEHCEVPEAWDGSPITDKQRRLAGLLARTTTRSGGRVLISKRIGHNRRIALLHQLIPQARFLDVTRDGRAVAYSLSRVDWWPQMPVWWWQDRTPQEWAAEGRDPLELCARHWVEETQAIETGLAQVPTGQVLRIRYEDLVADPLTVLSRIATFAGLDPEDETWRQELAQISFPNKNAAWTADLPAEQQAALAPLADQLTAMGYR
ncbi:MAG: sulfotransferase [Actinobacteria bacterium]|uniref:sulfotransferase family protein n=1 Tax=Nostocoides veronense TaxID=330836 RepID=UPI0031DE0129|nr:sulfotransferase [Actinomycetota bacterium]